MPAILRLRNRSLAMSLSAWAVVLSLLTACAGGPQPTIVPASTTREALVALASAPPETVAIAPTPSETLAPTATNTPKPTTTPAPTAPSTPKPTETQVPTATSTHHPRHGRLSRLQLHQLRPHRHRDPLRHPLHSWYYRGRSLLPFRYTMCMGTVRTPLRGSTADMTTASKPAIQSRNPLSLWQPEGCCIPG